MRTKGVLVLTSGVALFTVVATSYFLSIGPSKTRTHPKPSAKDVVIEFKVADSLDKLVITDSDCSPKNKGCIAVKQGHTGLVKFIFKPEDVADGWKLDEFKICKGKLKTNLDCNLSVWQRLGFFVADDDEGTKILVADKTGSFKLNQLSPGSSEFYLFDQNTVKKWFFYSITVCKDISNCISTDPPIDNKGRN